jgi:glycerophosphoryl diester phosphodiesterase
LGHAREATRPGWTLRSAYLDPLKARAREQGGKIHRDGPPLILLIDIKSEAGPTWAAIRVELEADPTLFTHFGADGIKPGTISVIISGAVPRAKIGEAAERLAACDGRPADLDKENVPVALVPLISDNWKNQFKWDGHGEMPAEEKTKLRTLAARCHDQGRKFRLWNAPDLPACWREQFDAAVDYINTDSPAALHAFLSEPGLKG